jgi:pyridoxal phosphate enzyme (YggS family)
MYVKRGLTRITATLLAACAHTSCLWSRPSLHLVRSPTASIKSQQFSTLHQVRQCSQLMSTATLAGASVGTIPESSSVVADGVITDNASIVMERIRTAAARCGRSPEDVTLVAVSKTKGADCVRALYDAGHRRFGENYMQELLDKAASLPGDIKWHFIGHLQSSKASKLIRDLPNLEVVETLDSIKLANKLNRACEENGKFLQVFIQVDTSGEDTKSGVAPEELLLLATHVVNDCKALQLAGLMTSKLLMCEILMTVNNEMRSDYLQLERLMM